MPIAICLTEQEKSVILDLLYDNLGQYSRQDFLNSPGEVDIDTDAFILRSILAKLDLQTPCSGGSEPMVVSCDDIGECLETPINETKVINIVKKLYRTGGLSTTVENTFIQQDGNVYIENHYVGGSETVPAPPPQDREPNHYDKLYGALEAVVKTINDANKDYLEVLENVSNTLELANMIAENLPIGGIGGSITAIAELADKLAEFASEQYLAYETPARLDGITCKLFCVFKDAEQVALQDIIGQIVVMALEEGVSLDFDGIAGIDSQEAMLTWFSQAFSGTTDAIVFWVCWLQQLYFMLYQNVFFGVSSFDRLWKRFLVSYEAFPNSGWQFCDCNGTTPSVYWYLGTYGSNGTTALPSYGETATLREGTYGWEYFATRGQSVANTGVSVLIPLVGVSISTVTVRLSYNATRLSAAGFRMFCNMQKWDVTGSTYLATYTTPTANGTDVEVVLTLSSPTTEQIKVNCWSGCATRDDASFISVHSIKVE